MHAPVGVMVVIAADRAREEVVDAVSRTGHRAFGVRSVEEAGARRGRESARIVLFDREGWDAGGRRYMEEHRTDDAQRVVMLADSSASRRRDEYQDAGVEEFLTEPLSELDLFLALDEVLSREAPPAPGPAPEAEEEQEPAQDVDGEDAGWREGKDVGGALTDLAEALREGRAKISNMSPVAVELQGVVGDGEAKISEMISQVNRDPNLVASLLRASNSAMYRGMPQVLDLQEAGRRLGTRRLGEIAQREALRGAFSSPDRQWSRVLGKMWRNTVLTAEAARALGEKLHLRRLGAIYTMGLFLDMGQVLIVDMYRKLGYPAPKDGVPKGELASELRARHAAMGMLLLKSWGMPASMQAVALHHHTPEELPSGTPVARHAWLLGGVSSALAERGYGGWAGVQLGPDVRMATAALGTSVEVLNEVVDGAISDWHEG